MRIVRQDTYIPFFALRSSSTKLKRVATFLFVIATLLAIYGLCIRPLWLVVKENRAARAMEAQGFVVGRHDVGLPFPMSWIVDRVGISVETGAVVSVANPQPLPSPMDSSPLGDFARLESLYLVSSRDTGDCVDDAMLDAMRPCNLRSLVVKGSSCVSDQSLRKLAYSVDLETLHVESEGITDSGLARLSECRSLRNLWLPSSRVHRSLAKIACDQLVDLDVSDSHVDDMGVKCLAAATRLQAVDLSGTSITDGSLQVLRQCSSLRKVRVDRTGVTTSGVRALLFGGSVESVSVIGTEIDIDSILELSHSRPDVTIYGGGIRGRRVVAEGGTIVYEGNAP